MSDNQATRIEQTGAEEVIWDLSDLHSGTADALTVDLAQMIDDTGEFFARWHDTVQNATDEKMLEFIQQYSAIVEQMDRIGSFVHLQWSTDTENPEYGKLLQSVREASARASRDIVFVYVSISKLPTERLDQLIASPLLAPYKHWFERMADYKPHLLSEEVEQVLSEKSVTSRAGWVRLHDELSNAQKYILQGKEYSQTTLLKLLYESNRETRKAAADALSVGLKEQTKPQSFIFNTVVSDHALNNRLRGYDTWISARNFDNEVSDSTVEALVSAVVGRYDLVERLFNLKKRLLGYDVLYDYDRYAPTGADSEMLTWNQAREIVLETYHAFHPETGNIAQQFFDKPWIHAPTRKGKSGGAYSAGTIPSAHPYVFMNYTGTNRDVQTLAHELGHGVHQYLSRQQGVLLMDTPLTIAETASVFGEMITFQHLLDAATDNKQRLTMLVTKLDDIVSTVFRQIALNRFEDAIHETRAVEGELSADRISELWMQSQRKQYGNSVILTEGYSSCWAYISHFMHTPGYVYAYAFGELLVLALYEIYQREPETFAPMYLKMLSAGGSMRPAELLRPFGIDTDDPAFWNVGLGAIERLIIQAEALA
ncbi:MAG: M3 family oligoendopeptidase [bacterium]|nr:M3 family oligoendopeptidase [bacterium]